MHNTTFIFLLGKHVSGAMTNAIAVPDAHVSVLYIVAHIVLLYVDDQNDQRKHRNFLICINDAVYHCCIMQLICTETKSGELSPSTAMLPQSGSSSCALQQGLNPMFFGALHLHWNCALPTKLVYVKKNLFFLSCTYDK